MFKCFYCNKEKSNFIRKADITINRGNSEISWIEDSNYRKKCIDCFISEVSFPIHPKNRDYIGGGEEAKRKILRIFKKLIPFIKNRLISTIEYNEALNRVLCVILPKDHRKIMTLINSFPRKTRIKIMRTIYVLVIRGQDFSSIQNIINYIWNKK